MAKKDKINLSEINVDDQSELPKSPINKTWLYLLSTQGLAVVLVLWYAFIIVPQERNEKKEWLTTISAIETYVNPKNQTLNDVQAEVVLKLYSKIFLKSLELEVSNRHYYNDDFYSDSKSGYLDPFASKPDLATISKYFFDERFEYTLDTNETVVLKQMNNLIEKFNSLLKNDKEERVRLTSCSFDYAISSNRSISQSLDRLVFDGYKLFNYWNNIESKIKPYWNEKVGRLEYITQVTKDYNREFKKYLSVHTKYFTIESKLNKIGIIDDTPILNRTQFFNEINSLIYQEINLITEQKSNYLNQVHD